jgi:hypothetical protein
MGRSTIVAHDPPPRLRGASPFEWRGSRYLITMRGAGRGPRWFAVSCFHTRPAMFL